MPRRATPVVEVFGLNSSIRYNLLLPDKETGLKRTVYHSVANKKDMWYLVGTCKKAVE